MSNVINRARQLLNKIPRPEMENGLYKVVCVCCESPFLAKRPEAKYCSYRCTNDSYIAKRAVQRQQARMKVCGHCAVNFEAKRNDAKYCSASCKQKAYRSRSK